jgi:hypothetical protein
MNDAGELRRSGGQSLYKLREGFISLFACSGKEFSSQIKWDYDRVHAMLTRGLYEASPELGFC